MAIQKYHFDSAQSAETAVHNIPQMLDRKFKFVFIPQNTANPRLYEIFHAEKIGANIGILKWSDTPAYIELDSGTSLYKTTLEKAVSIAAIYSGGREDKSVAKS